ncbi:MAG: alpha/beta hydrolase [Thermotogota bacterium]|nr:alpha/beta hydrolase [Thermotogota bacterium]
MRIKLIIGMVFCIATIFSFANDESSVVFEEYLNAFLNGNYQRAVELQNEQITNAFGVQAMEQSANMIINQYGKPETTYNTDIMEQDQYKIYMRLMKTTKGYLKFTVTVDQDLKIAGFYAAPAPDPRKKLSYVDKNSFEEQPVKFGKEGWELDGILTLPVNKESYPMVIIVGGSGPTDMDGTVGPNTPYKDIAEGLASSGIAVMRYNKRTAQHGQKVSNMTGEIENIVDFEYSEDILLAIAYATNIEKVDSIILAGHSLGGTVVPKIATASELVNGIILLAPGIRRLAQISLDQNRYVKDYLGITHEQMEQVEVFFSMILNHELSDDYPIQSGLTAKYYYELDEYSPLEDLENYGEPVLILQGEEDFQATMEGDYLPFREKYGQRDNFTFLSFPTLNHLFMKTKEGVFHWTDEYNKPGFVDEKVIESLSEWNHMHY